MSAGFKKFLGIGDTPESSPYNQRLDSEIFIFSKLLENRTSLNKGNDNDAGWIKTARQLIKRARESLSNNNIDDGWKALNAAKRLEIHGMTENERKVVAIQLENEASKLNEWRKSTIQGILGGEENQKIAVQDPGVLIKAVELRDEHFDNRHLLNTLSRKHFQFLFILLILNLSAVITYFSIHADQSLSEFGSGFGMTAYVAGVLLFGFLGSITSSILFLRFSFATAKIIDVKYLWLVAISKIIISGAFALFIFFLVGSSFADKVDIFNFRVNNLIDYLALAFVSGFTERLAQKAIEWFVGRN